MSLGQDETLGSEAILVKSERGDSGLRRPRIPAADHKAAVPGLSVTVVSRPSLALPERAFSNLAAPWSSRRPSVTTAK